MWIQKKIREDLDNIHPRCIYKLSFIDTLPHKKAIKAASYLWEGCFQSSNDIWLTVCSGLLYEIPEKWFEENVEEILDVTNIDWSDDFEYYNMCAAFRHIPNVIHKILEYAKVRIPSENRDELLNDVRESIGDKEHYDSIIKDFENIDKRDLFF